VPDLADRTARNGRNGDVRLGEVALASTRASNPQIQLFLRYQLWNARRGVAGASAGVGSGTLAAPDDHAWLKPSIRASAVSNKFRDDGLF
jgi:hypothetical protein